MGYNQEYKMQKIPCVTTTFEFVDGLQYIKFCGAWAIYGIAITTKLCSDVQIAKNTPKENQKSPKRCQRSHWSWFACCEQCFKRSVNTYNLQSRSHRPPSPLSSLGSAWKCSLNVSSLGSTQKKNTGLFGNFSQISDPHLSTILYQFFLIK